MSGSVESVVVNETDKAVQPLKNKIAELEVQQYSRRCNVRIYGLCEEKGENCYDVVANFCRNDLILL